MASRDVELVGSAAQELENRVGERFGVLPNFFRLAPETPEITEKLWGFAQAAYLDSPLPSLFKERLFVYLSRFCSVRYCIARHAGFLAGVGRPSGDKRAHAQSVEEIVGLLQRPFPRGDELESRLSLCASCPAPLVEMPTSDAMMEEVVFALAGHVFLETRQASACLAALERLLCAVQLQYLLLFLAFVGAAHYWTKVHPEIELEDDIKQLLATHEGLASCILNDSEAPSDSVSQSLLEELPSLRQKADKAIALLAAIVDSSDDAIISKNLDGVVTSWNAGAERLFGYSAKEAIGQHISLIIPINRRGEETVILERLRRGERIEHFDTVRVRKDGTTVDISLTISPLRDTTGKIVGASKIARDFTQRKQIERELHESEARFRLLAEALDTQVQFRTQELRRRNEEILHQSERLHDLSGRLLRMQDEERRHIARELHDSAGQTLAALGMNLAQFADAKHDPARMAKIVEDAQAMVQHLTQELRTTSYLLHPPLLDENGLSSALSWYVQGLTKRSGLHIDLKIPEDFGRLPSDTELVIFRLVQECLTNIHRHSGSETALIRVGREGDEIQVEVQDQGKGMSQKQLAVVQSEGSGVGIRGMRERLRHIHGELIIESNALGTRILATLPAPIPSTKGQDEIPQLGIA